MNPFLKFFTGIGKYLGKALGIVRHVVTEEQLAHAVRLAEVAVDKFIDNAARRDWVLHELMTLPLMSESVARLLIELAVQALKAKAHDGIEAIPDATGHPV